MARCMVSYNQGAALAIDQGARAKVYICICICICTKQQSSQHTTICVLILFYVCPDTVNMCPDAIYAGGEQRSSQQRSWAVFGWCTEPASRLSYRQSHRLTHLIKRGMGVCGGCGGESDTSGQLAACGIRI